MAFLTPRGLCATCAATEDTASDSPAPPPAPAPTTFTAGPEPATATAGPEVTTGPPARAALPHAPPGYDLLNRLGSGGMGAVYLAREHASERLVAMKFLHEAGDPSSYDRFLVEVRVLAQLDHPGIVRVFSSDFLRATPFFTMEYMEGGPLSRAVADGNPLPALEAVRLVRAVCEAVAAAHARGVVHRDLKPSNVLLAADGSPRVSDFGLAKRLDRDDGLTRASGALGTAAYMPPEQVSRRNGEVGPWSDVYGLGATLYHLLTGRAPFCGDTTEETILRVLSESPVRPRALRPDIPAGLEAIVLKCLAKEPRERYQSAAELAEDLDRFRAGQKPLAPELTRWRRARQWARGNRRGLGVALTGLAMLLTLLVALGAALRPKPVPPDPRDLIRAELARGQTASLLEEDGQPRWHRWRLRTATVGPSPVKGDVAGYYESADTALLELLDDPGIDRYRITAEVRFLGSRLPNGGSVGIFFGYTEPGGQAAARCFGMTFKDVRRGGQIPPLEAQLRLLDTTWLQQVEGLPRPQVRNFSSRLLDLYESSPPPWHVLIADVAPDSIRFLWKPSPGAPEEPLCDFVRDGPQHFLVIRHPADPARPPDRRDVPTGWSPRRPLGIWADQSAVSFRNVSVVPSPDPGAHPRSRP